MSRTTVMAVWPGDRAEVLEELRNSHGSAPVVWNEMAKRHLGFGDFEYSRRADEIWPLYKREDIPAHQRAVLLMTYDNAMVMQVDYKRAAGDIRAFLSDFPPHADYVNHWSRIADLLAGELNCPAVCFWMTSVCNNPFQGGWNEDVEDFDPPEWGLFWSVYELADQAIPA